MKGLNRRYLYALGALLALLVLLGTVEALALRAVPGQLLYGLKRTTEAWRLDLAGSAPTQASLRLEFLDRRVAELARLQAAKASRQVMNQAAEEVRAAEEEVRQVLKLVSGLEEEHATAARHALEVLKSLNAQHPDANAVRHAIAEIERHLAAVEASLPQQTINIAPKPKSSGTKPDQSVGTNDPEPEPAEEPETVEEDEAEDDGEVYAL